jgi:hypothetical protein
MERNSVPNDNEIFKKPQIFIEELFQLYQKGLIDDEEINDEVALMIFGVKFLSLC